MLEFYGFICKRISFKCREWYTWQKPEDDFKVQKVKIVSLKIMKSMSSKSKLCSCSSKAFMHFFTIFVYKSLPYLMKIILNCDITTRNFCYWKTWISLRPWCVCTLLKNHGHFVQNYKFNKQKKCYVKYHY